MADVEKDSFLPCQLYALGDAKKNDDKNDQKADDMCHPPLGLFYQNASGNGLEGQRSDPVFYHLLQHEIEISYR